MTEQLANKNEMKEFNAGGIGEAIKDFPDLAVDDMGLSTGKVEAKLMPEDKIQSFVLDAKNAGNGDEECTIFAKKFIDFCIKSKKNIPIVDLDRVRNALSDNGKDTLKSQSGNESLSIYYKEYFKEKPISVPETGDRKKTRSKNIPGKN